jgi:hypothetical protein
MGSSGFREHRRLARTVVKRHLSRLLEMTLYLVQILTLRCLKVLDFAEKVTLSGWCPKKNNFLYFDHIDLA